MFIVCGGGPGLEFFDVLGGDVEEGAAEEGEADEEGVGAVGVGANFAFEAGEVAADDADGVVDAECGGDKLHGGVGVAEHEFELLHLCLADDGYGFVEAVRGTARAVDKEAEDVGEGDDAAALLLAALYEYHRGDDYAVDLLAPSVCPLMHLLLDGDISFKVDFLQFIGYGFLMTGIDYCDEPFGVGYAYGAVNARGHCRIFSLGIWLICQQRYFFPKPRFISRA